MGVIVTKDEDENTALTERINTDLRRRAMETSGADGVETDFSEDTEYLKEYAKTGRFTWIWFVLIALAIASLIFIILI
ncbi:hypothetical protein IJG21_03610 [Candidatus Saccharibacteria bacterium]|nr:hypothetical protein [Candidatus Saccharibacteria bacterium]